MSQLEDEIRAAVCGLLVKYRPDLLARESRFEADHARFIAQQAANLVSAELAHLGPTPVDAAGSLPTSMLAVDAPSSPARAPRMFEARITVGGTELSFAEALSLRVGLDMAVAHFSQPGSCGGDEHGRRMRENYLRHLGHVRELVLRAGQSGEAVLSVPEPP